MKQIDWDSEIGGGKYLSISESWQAAQAVDSIANREGDHYLQRVSCFLHTTFGRALLHELNEGYTPTALGQGIHYILDVGNIAEPREELAQWFFCSLVPDIPVEVMIG